MSTSLESGRKAIAKRPANQASPTRRVRAAVLCLMVLWAALGPRQPASAQQAPGEAQATRPQQAETGTLRLLIFYGDGPVAGATVKAAGQTGTTNRDGTVELSVPAGMTEVYVKFQAMDVIGSRLVSGTQSLGVVAGETSEAIVALESGESELSWDVEGPTKAEVEGAQAAQEATEFGTIAGEITSIEDSAPVAQARVFVRGVDTDAETDADGRFALKVPVGTHSISVIHPQYSTLSRPDIDVRVDDLTEVAVVLTPASVRMDDFIVTAPHIEGSVAGLMDDRRDSSAVSDAIGREDISKMPASDAAAAAQRVVGATIVGGRFVYVRGLGERYSNALLNGGPLPSPEPDRSTVPLDLFPAQILESLDIVKTFTPDFPGDFAGGSVRITTRGVPDELVYNMSLSAGYNSQSTLRRKYAEPRGGLDWLGFDDGQRALSSELPDYKLTIAADKPDGDLVLQPELDSLAPKINTRMSPERQFFGPDVSASVLMGNGWKFKKGRRFGVLGSLVYRRGFEARREERNQYQYNTNAVDRDNLRVWTSYDTKYSNLSVRWGAFLTSILELSEDHIIKLHLMHSQLGDSTTQVASGLQENENLFFETTRMSFESRGLTSGQLQGEHIANAMNEAVLEWKVFLSLAARSQPDTRDVAFAKPFNSDDDVWGYFDSADSGRHFFSKQSEFSRGGAFDWTQPLVEGKWATKLKAGTMLNARKRAFSSRRLNLRPVPIVGRPKPPTCGPGYDPIRCPDLVLTDDVVGTAISLDEGYRDGDVYNAILNVYAGYLMGEMNFTEQWRLMAGARVEKTQQELTSVDPFTDEDLPDYSSSLSSLDWLPAASLVYSPTEEVNIRAAVSRTLARPQLRELAPFAFTDYFGGLSQTGNPELTLTRIWNADLRFEWYPTPREVIAVSAFTKKFYKPIEPVLNPTGGSPNITYENAEGARLFGVELEARKALDFVHDKLEDLSFIASLMIAKSQIEVVQTGQLFLTNTERPMVNQAPYVVNASLDYENEHGTQVRLLYNIAGKQLVQVGTEQLPDAYLHPRHTLDLVASQRIRDRWRLKASVQNMLNAEYLVTQGRAETAYNVQRSYREGISVSLGLSLGI